MGYEPIRFADSDCFESEPVRISDTSVQNIVNSTFVIATRGSCWHFGRGTIQATIITLVQNIINSGLGVIF